MDVLVAVLASMLAAPAPPSGEVSEVEKLYVEGQDRYAERDYASAAQTWTRLLELMPESVDNRAIRESVIINILEAHLHAYQQLVDAKGRRNVRHLREAKRTLTSYFASFTSTHGERVAVSLEVREKADEIDEALRDAEGPAVPRPPAIEPPPPPPPKPAATLKPARTGNGLIIGGSVATAVGLGMVAMIPVGSVRGRRADAAYDDASARLTADPGDADAADDLATADVSGQKANALLIAGVVLAPVLVAAGATMIGFGVRAKQRSRRSEREPAVTPALAPGFVGVSVAARF